MSAINYSEKIPNNVDLGSDRTLQRALEQWQPNFISWWDDMGPEGTTDNEVYLRTAVSVDPQGWAQFGHVKMHSLRIARKQCVSASNTPKPRCTWSRRTHLCLPIDCNNSKRWSVSVHPFKIVHQAPIGIAANVNSILDAVEYSFKRTVYIFDPFVIVARCNAVLGNNDRHMACLVPCATNARL